MGIMDDLGDLLMGHGSSSRCGSCGVNHSSEIRTIRRKGSRWKEEYIGGVPDKDSTQHDPQLPRNVEYYPWCSPCPDTDTVSYMWQTLEDDCTSVVYVGSLPNVLPEAKEKTFYWLLDADRITDIATHGEQSGEIARRVARIDAWARDLERRSAGLPEVKKTVEKNICPVMSHPTNEQYGGRFILRQITCLREQCVWWESENGGHCKYTLKG